MNIFDLENDLPDEILASTSTSTPQPTNVTRSNFRVIPSADGNINKFRIRCEPFSAASAPVSTALPAQPVASSSSTTLPKQSTDLSLNSFQPVATSSSVTLSQPQSILCPNPITPPYPAPWSSKIPSQPLQNTQPVNSLTSYESSAVQSIMLSRHGGYPTSSPQPVVSSSSFSSSSHSQSNQPAYYSSPSTSFSPQMQNNLPCGPINFSLNSVPTQSPSNQSTYSATSFGQATVSWRPRPNPEPTTASASFSYNAVAPNPAQNPGPFNFSAVAPNPSASTPASAAFTFATPPLAHSTFHGQSSNSASTAMSDPFSHLTNRLMMGRRIACGKLIARQKSTANAAHPMNTSDFPRQNIPMPVAGSDTGSFMQRQSQNPVNAVRNTTSTEQVSSSNCAAAPKSNTQEKPVKEWQKPITKELRDHLVKGWVDSMFPPNATLNANTNAWLQGFKAYIRKAEHDIYEAANSKSEYYQLLAERQYKIRTNLNKKRQEKRAEQQLQQQQQQQQQLQNMQPSQNFQQDVDMPQTRSPDAAAPALDSNLNISNNQPLDTTSATSSVYSLVDNLLNNKQKTYTKEWHKQIGAELREILIKEFVQKMLPVPGSESIINNEESPAAIEERVKSYVKNVECDIYQKADSRIEYYEKLADKYCKMQEELRKGNFAALETS